MIENSIRPHYPEYVRDLAEDHPLRVYFDENVFIRRVLDDVRQADAQVDFSKYYNLFNQLGEVEKRFARKENQLFPFLEKRGWFGPSQGMWAFHDSIRDLFRSLRKKIETKDIAQLKNDTDYLTSEMLRLMAVEETRLLPIAFELLTKEDWQEMQIGESEIGWVHKAQKHQTGNLTTESPIKTEGKWEPGSFLLEEGRLNLEQINLMFKFMPVDLTLVDENDKVVFYNRGEERVFPRSAGVIGREVRFCHPPKSVDTVLRILEEFKKGTRNDAEFWIRFKSRVIHIRYFAIRSADGKYKGVMEMSQDITEIQKLEGEKRLLNWD